MMKVENKAEGNTLNILGKRIPAHKHPQSVGMGLNAKLKIGSRGEVYYAREHLPKRYKMEKYEAGPIAGNEKSVADKKIK